MLEGAAIFNKKSPSRSGLTHAYTIIAILGNCNAMRAIVQYCARSYSIDACVNSTITICGINPAW